MSNDELLTRAVEQVVPLDLAKQKLASGKPLRLYLGIDPTGAKLHIGHSVPLLKLKAFADAGHHVIFLVGSFTAMIGDPSGRDSLREPLTKGQVEKNFQTYKEQAGKILDWNKVEIRYNHEWHEKMQLGEIMSLASNFTVQQMLQRDMFKNRMQWKARCLYCGLFFPSPLQFASLEEFDDTELEGNLVRCPHCKKKTPIRKDNIVPPENPPTPTELLYPLMQGYDSVVLDVDFEVGGNDQLFNMLCGRKLQKKFGKREKFVMTMKLIDGTDGRKMSKTYDNCIYLEDEPSDMYGKVMSVNDELIPLYMECCTEIAMKEVEQVGKDLKGGKVNPKDLKMRLAKDIVRFYHGEKAAEHAVKEFQNVFADKGIPDDIMEVKVEKGSLLVDILVKHKLASSKTDAKRLFEQGGVHMNDQTVKSVDAKAESGVVKVGKRKFVKIVIV